MSGYGFDNVYIELNVQEVLARVSDAMLWRYYFGQDFELKKNYPSPLRKGDDNPSFNLYDDKRGRTMFKDFGAGGSHGDVFEFLQMTQSLDHREALIKVNVDFKLGLGKPDEQKYTGYRPIGVRAWKKLEKFEEEFAVQTSILMKAYSRPYTERDLDYWMRYGITKETLDLYKVHCIKRVDVKKPINGVLQWITKYTNLDSNPCYGYYFPVSKHIKCYWPLAIGDQIRFLGNVNNYEDIQGYYQCNVKRDKSNKLLILTKSMKDCMCLRELGYEAMAIHGEAHHFYEDFIRHIKKYYPRIISIYDRDRTGVKGARFLWKTHKIAPYFIPKILTGCKDVSDVYKQYGRERIEGLMKDICGF